MRRTGKKKNGDEPIKLDRKTGIITISAEGITFNPEPDKFRHQS